MRGGSRFALGTHLHIRVVPVKGRSWKEDLSAVFREVARWERLIDPNRGDSLLSRFNRRENGIFRWQGGQILLSLIRRGLEYARKTEGRFDPFILPLTRLWGFSSPAPPLAPPDSSRIRNALSGSGYRRVRRTADGFRLPEGGGFDGGGYLKGWAADRIRERLISRGYTRAVIDVGGDVALIGGRPPQYGRQNGWIVMISHPRDSRRYWCSLLIRDKAVVTSGDYERFFMHKKKRYHHLLDPVTGYPADRCISVTAIGPSAELADALSTAVFVAGPEAGLRLVKGFSGYGVMILSKRGEKITPVFSSGFRKQYHYRLIP